MPFLSRRHLALIAGLLLLVACTPSPPQQPTPTGAPATVAPAASPPVPAKAAVSPAASPAAPVSVQLKDLQFNPQTITIVPGTTVTWVQAEAIPHTVTSGTPGAADLGKLFDANLPDLNQTFSFTFNQAGTFPYFCRYHLPNMVGTVVVQAPGTAMPAASPSPATGMPRAFTTVEPGQVLPPPFDAKLVGGGLENPRGFTWGPDGAIYVAEAGSKDAGPVTGTGSDEERVQLLFCEGWKQSRGDPPPPQCPQEDPQYVRGGRISRISADGTRTTVVDGLPVIVGMFGFAEGPASVAFVGEDLYVLIVHALGKNRMDGFNTGVYRVNADGSGTLIAALDEYNQAHPPKVIPPDYDLSEPHDMIALNRKLYVSDGNAGVIFEIDPAAPEATRTRHLADLSDRDGTHPVLTGLATGPDGNLYVTNLTKAPYPRGGAKIWQVRIPDGQITDWASGLTLGVGLAVSADNTFYVAEFASVIPAAPYIAPGGRVVKTTRNGPIEEVRSTLLTLFFPTIIRIGPDGDLYVTYFSIGNEGGQARGAIYRFDLPPVDGR